MSAVHTLDELDAMPMSSRLTLTVEELNNSALANKLQPAELWVRLFGETKTPAQ
jgi:hypothetical protein